MDKNYDYKNAEYDIQQFWNKYKIYSLENYQGPLFSIDTPPPTVSGNLHIGHIFSYTQTDIIARYKRMSGYKVFYPLGFDDNGLPTEKYIEKKLGINAHNLKRSEFINLCLQETAKVEKDFEKLWKRIGLSVDWAYSYSTIDKNSQILSQTSFILLYKKGFIYRKSEPALYCTVCRTTLAQAELDDIEKSSFFNDIIFKSDSENLIVSTTRPELLPSVTALLYYPDDPRYKHLKDKKAITPIFGQEIPIIEDTDVDPKKGSGLVMVSSFGDKQDIIWTKKYNLPLKQSIGIDGKWTEITGPLQGLKATKARETVIELLKKENLLTNQKAITHSVNVHERCKNEIEYLVLPQWFLKILPFKETFLKIADDIKWYPSFMKSRYINWVENISWDWCLSRQRFYGIPFPVWHCGDCTEIILADIKDLPIDPQEKSFSDTSACPKCKSNNIVPDTDVMDTWNTSSLTPYICNSVYNKTLEVFNNQKNTFIPMNMRPQAHDIIRTWSFYTIVKSWMHNKNIPWNSIVISGHVLIGPKEKISKSKENNPLAPEVLLERYSADSIRYWTASAALGYDVSFSENQIKIGQKLLVKLWNVFRFANEHIRTFDKKRGTAKELSLVNKWILHKASECYQTYKSYFDKNEFSLALDTVEQFFWHNFCDNYLELIKDQLFNPKNYPNEEVLSTKWTLYYLGIRILQLYAPFIPHIVENLWMLFYKEKENCNSIHQTKFEIYQIINMFDEENKIMNSILTIIDQIRKLKSEQQLSLKTEIEALTISAPKTIQSNLKNNESLIKGITQAKTINYTTESIEPALIQKDNLWLADIKIQ